MAGEHGLNQQEIVVETLSLRGGMNERDRPWSIRGNQAEKLSGLNGKSGSSFR